MYSYKKRQTCDLNYKQLMTNFFHHPLTFCLFFPFIYSL